MIPQIASKFNKDVKNLEIVPFPSLTHKLFEHRIIGYVDGVAAIRQTVLHILSTERYAYPIYDEDYGIELEQYIGKDFNFIKATIGNTIKSALLQDDRIVDVKILSIEQVDSNKCLVSFSVFSKLGNFNEELDFDI